MSQGLNILHSHSGIEREMKFPKHEVLIDIEFGDGFIQKKPYRYDYEQYYKVNILEFVNKGGIFKNLMK